MKITRALLLLFLNPDHRGFDVFGCLNFYSFQTFYFRGTDMSQVPCFKETAMNTIGLSAISGALYNFTTSKNPTKLVAVTMTVTYFGTW